MKPLEVGLLYIAFHNQLVKKFGENTIILRKEFFEKIGRFQHISKQLRPIIIKEMQEKELIEQVNRDNIKILPLKIDLEKDPSKLFKIAGLY